MKKKEQFISRSIGGQNIMVPVGKTAHRFSGLITLNDVAAFIWNNIEKVSSPEEMADLICTEFEVDHETALSDTIEIFRNLKQAGWIES